MARDCSHVEGVVDRVFFGGYGDLDENEARGRFRPKQEPKKEDWTARVVHADHVLFNTLLPEGTRCVEHLRNQAHHEWIARVGGLEGRAAATAAWELVREFTDDAAGPYLRRAEEVVQEAWDADVEAAFVEQKERSIAEIRQLLNLAEAHEDVADLLTDEEKKKRPHEVVVRRSRAVIRDCRQAINARRPWRVRPQSRWASTIEPRPPKPQPGMRGPRDSKSSSEKSDRCRRNKEARRIRDHDLTKQLKNNRQG